MKSPNPDYRDPPLVFRCPGCRRKIEWKLKSELPAFWICLCGTLFEPSIMLKEMKDVED